MRNSNLVRKAILSMALVLVASSVSKGQYRGPQDYRGTDKVSIPLPSNYPPVNSGMPTDVLQGYIVFDSLMHIPIETYQIDSIANAMGNSDTIHYAMRYLYEMKDYDPIAFYQFLFNFPYTGEYLRRAPLGLVEDALGTAANVIPDSGGVIAALANADAIVDLVVNDTFSVIDTTKPSGLDKNKEALCTVLDLIKGQNLPFCDNMGARPGKGTVTLSDSGHCIAFSYWPYWEGNISYQGVQHPGAPDWVTPGTEFIAFLRFVGLGRDKVQNYITVSPGCLTCSTMGLYPVQADGTVYDPNNDFGFGTGLTLADFKAKLRDKIASIISYHN